MKTHIANIITGIRILGSILLAFVPVFSAVYYTVYLTCGLSDMADGMIARKPTMSAPSEPDSIQPPIFYLQRYRL